MTRRSAVARNYRGWLIYGAGDTWAAYRHGVRLRANSLSVLMTMLELRADDDPFTPHGKAQ